MRLKEGRKHGREGWRREREREVEVVKKETWDDVG